MTLAPSTLPRRDPAALEEQDFHWRAAVRDRIASMDLRRKEWVGDFGSFKIRDLGDLLITDWECPPVEGIRGNNYARRDDDALLVFTASAGKQIFEFSDQTVVLRPGAVLITSTRAAGSFVIPDRLTKRTIKVPMTALSPFDTGSRVPECLLVDTAENPLATILHDFLIGIDGQYGRMSSLEIESARSALLTLIAGMIRASELPDNGRRRPATAAAATARDVDREPPRGRCRQGPGSRCRTQRCAQNRPPRIRSDRRHCWRGRPKAPPGRRQRRSGEHESLDRRDRAPLGILRRQPPRPRIPATNVAFARRLPRGAWDSREPENGQRLNGVLPSAAGTIQPEVEWNP